MFESSTNTRVYKPLSHIQHWIDTGYFPYNKKQFNMDEDTQSDSCSVSEPENCFKSPQHVGKEKASEQPNYNDNFSSSSVDTTAYILSNANITKKAETIAIVEGAKSNAVVQSQNIQSTNMMPGNMYENIPNRACEQTNKNIIFNDNNDNYKQSCMEASQSVLTQSNDVEKNINQIETNLDADVSQSTLSNDDGDDALSKSYYNNLIYKRLAQTFNSPYRKYNTERNSLNISFTCYTQNATPPSKLIKNGHRKKLYTGRDSPVDLVNMSSCNRNSLSKARHSSHPALDFGYKLPNNHKVKKLSRIRCFSLFNNSSHLFKQPRRRKKKPTSKITPIAPTNSSKTDTVTVNNNSINNSAVDKRVRRNFLQDLDTSFSTDVSNENKSKSTTHLGKTNGSKELTNLIPVVCLMRVSEDEIKRRTRSNRETVDSLSTTTLSRIHRRNNYGKRKRKRTGKQQTLNRKTLSISTGTNSSQSYKNSNNATANLNPVVCLKRLSESDIQKYKGVANKESNIDNFQSTVHIERLSVSNITKYESIKDREVLRKDVSSETTKSQNVDMITNKLSRYNKSLNLPIPALNVINVRTEDSSSDSSTILFYKCGKTEHSKCRLSNDSLISETDFEPNVIQPSTKRIRRTRSDRIEQKNSKVTDEELIEAGRSRRSKKSKTDATNQTTVNDSEGISRMKTGNKHRSQPGLDVINNSINSHGYNTRRRKSEELRNINNSNDLLLMKDMKQIKNSLIAPGRHEMICKSSSSSSSSSSNSVDVINKNNYKEISHNLFSSDEDAFVQLVRCPEDIGKMELKQRYKILTQEFNKSEEPQDNNDLHTMHESPDNKSHSKFVTKSSIRTENNFVSTKRKRFSKRSSNLPAKDNCGEEFEKEGTMNNSKQKVLLLLNTSGSQNKSKTTRLRFQTRLFQSDSESSYMSHRSSNKSLLGDEE
ncbi:putative uncharacterized protein DDB_G0282499 isoform X2 [Ceratina calcarata]|nr:putative uncharacterized protein DDB_G0282499 isoform X2 [Ceratina calcarata]